MGSRVVIVGGGVVGLSVALYAARAGHRVTVLERRPAGFEGCSFGNSGLVVPSHLVPLAAPGMVALGLRWMASPQSPFYVRPRLSRGLLSWGWRFWRAATAERVERAAPVLRDLLVAGRACYEELDERWGGELGLERKGLLLLCESEHGLAEEAAGAERARRLGIEARVLDAGEAAALNPGLRLAVAGGVYFPGDCHLAPARLMRLLRQDLERAGVEIAWETEVAGWRIEGDRIAAAGTAQGEVAGDEFVLSGGAWSAVAARGLGLSLPLEAGKGYSLTLPRPRRQPEVPMILSEARVAITPMEGGLRFGGTMELAGLDERINPARLSGIVRSVARYLPDFQAQDFEGLAPWCGLRPCSPDGLPYVGRFGRYANLSAATGHAMLGVSLGPITGRLVAQLLAGEKPTIDLGPLSPDRYA